MASPSSPVIPCIVFLVTFISAAMNSHVVGASKEFKVGDSEGWRQPPANQSALYSRWAAAIRFHVGDSLRFEYKNDSLLVVDKWGYYHCDTGKPISVFTDGDTVVSLDQPGFVYFISGQADHCLNGQHLAVKVIALRPIPRSPPSAANPPGLASAPSPFSSSAVSDSAAFVSISLALTASFMDLLWAP
ncbi:mavicyanin [Diospyros lotus]|uniref:mavicyanin n=1 Tax=Diospyros lotus TaxID=55363 RepID=UPI002257ADFE|nr:mavicyanin [Diospyros lotus]